MNMMENMKNGEEQMKGFAKRTLLLNVDIDVSGSMKGPKIGYANQALAQAVEMVGQFCKEQNVRLLVSVVKFSDQAEFVKRMEEYHEESFEWQKLEAGGMTEMGKSFDRLCELNREEIQGQYRLIPPVDLLISDGYSTCTDSDLNESLEKLVQHPLHKKAIRIPIGIGHKCDHEGYSFDEKTLRRFGNQELVLTAENVDELVKAILWTSLSASQMSVTPEMMESKNLGEYLEKQRGTMGGIVGSAINIPNAVETESEKTQKTFLI